MTARILTLALAAAVAGAVWAERRRCWWANATAGEWERGECRG